MPRWIYPELEKQLPNTVENAEKVLEFYRIYNSFTKFDYTFFIHNIKKSLDALRKRSKEDSVIWKHVLSHLNLAEFAYYTSDKKTWAEASQLLAKINAKYHSDIKFILETNYEY